MHCSRCQHENRSAAKYCEECGACLDEICPKCGSHVSASAKFCSQCGHQVGLQVNASSGFPSPEIYTPKHLAQRIRVAKGALEGERKLVTVLFADIRGSMELITDRDPEEAQKLLDPV